MFRRLGAVGLLLGGLVALILLWQAASEAGSPPFAHNDMMSGNMKTLKRIRRSVLF